MAEPEDVVLPILRTIQTNLRRLEGKVDNQGETLLNVADKLDGMENLMRWHMGMTSEHQHAIEQIRTKRKELETRVSVLEEQP